MAVAEQPIVRAENLRKRFDGVVALSGVSFDLLPGELHALCGENGAGKSTLIKILSGVHVHGSYEGEVYVRGQRAEFHSTRDAEAAGVSVIHQELALVSEMTVAENLKLGHEPRRFGLVDWETLYADARVQLARFGMENDAARPVSELGIGRQQLVEIAKALGRNSSVLILDEPTAALADQEVQILLELLRELKAQGIACIYISHKLDEVFAVADRITVLRDGAAVATFRTADTRPDEIIAHMVGRQLGELFPSGSRERGGVKLSVQHLHVARSRSAEAELRDISFEVHAGEVLGIGGLMGAGRTELILHLFGAWGVRTQGRVELDGRPFEPSTPAQAVAGGVALVTEDRKRLGAVLPQSIGFNLSLSALGRVTRHGLIDAEREFELTRAIFDRLRIKAGDLELPVASLSGGNQQKVVLGKALMSEPSLILLDEPTRGIDVGAKAEIYSFVQELVQQGKAVIMVSSELPELLGLSDRILMLHDGTVGGEFTRAEATEERLLGAAMGRWHGAA